jgi:hypothetical protein
MKKVSVDHELASEQASVHGSRTRNFKVRRLQAVTSSLR